MPHDYDALVAKLDETPPKANGHLLEASEKNVGLRRAADIAMEPISWLWPGWLAAGKLHMLGGVPGTGKTTIALGLAATISRGGPWPDGSASTAAGNVLVWSGEDDAADTLIPRLIAMGADLDRIHLVSDVTDPDGRRPFDPAQDMPALIARARAVGDVRLLIVDPVVSTVAGDSHKNAEVRRGLAPLVTFGHELRAAVIGVTHFSKGTQGRDPLDRLTGSLAFGAAPRLVFAASKKMAEDGTEEGRVLVRVKSNIGPDGGAIAYSLAQAELPQGIVTSHVVWGLTIEGNARDILADAEQQEEDADELCARDDAKAFLLQVLEEGPVAASQIFREARDAGHSERTVKRAKKDLGIVSVKAGMSAKWRWELPTKGATMSKGAHIESVAPWPSSLTPSNEGGQISRRGPQGQVRETGTLQDGQERF
jgi:putative DNA primase/helicase